MKRGGCFTSYSEFGKGNAFEACSPAVNVYVVDLPCPSDSTKGNPLEAPIDLSNGDNGPSQSLGSEAAGIRTRLSVLCGTVELGAVLRVLLSHECCKLSWSTDEREVVLIECRLCKLCTETRLG